MKRATDSRRLVFVFSSVFSVSWEIFQEHFLGFISGFQLFFSRFLGLSLLVSKPFSQSATSLETVSHQVCMLTFSDFLEIPQNERAQSNKKIKFRWLREQFGTPEFDISEGYYRITRDTSGESSLKFHRVHLLSEAAETVIPSGPAPADSGPSGDFLHLLFHLHPLGSLSPGTVYFLTYVSFPWFSRQSQLSSSVSHLCSNAFRPSGMLSPGSSA